MPQATLELLLHEIDYVRSTFSYQLWTDAETIEATESTQGASADQGLRTMSTLLCMEEEMGTGLAECQILL